MKIPSAGEAEGAWAKFPMPKLGREEVPSVGNTHFSNKIAYGEAEETNPELWGCSFSPLSKHFRIR